MIHWFFRKDFDRFQWASGFNGLGTVILYLIMLNFWKSKSKFYAGVNALIVSILNFDTLCLISALLRWFNDGSDNTALLLWFLLKIRSVRILDTTICSGSLVWLFSPAWNAIKLTLPGGWLHLSFRGHRPYLFRSDDCSYSRTNARRFPTYPPTQNPSLFTLRY